MPSHVHGLKPHDEAFEAQRDLDITDTQRKAKSERSVLWHQQHPALVVQITAARRTRSVCVPTSTHYTPFGN